MAVDAHRNARGGGGEKRPIVEHMVCPRCAATHGKEHAVGCPNVWSWPDLNYAEGWDAAQAHYSLAIARINRQVARRIASGLRNLTLTPRTVADGGLIAAWREFVADLADAVERRL